MSDSLVQGLAEILRAHRMQWPMCCSCGERPLHPAPSWHSDHLAAVLAPRIAQGIRLVAIEAITLAAQYVAFADGRPTPSSVQQSEAAFLSALRQQEES